MKAVLNDEMKKIDKTAIEGFGIPGAVLMENAGLSVVEEIVKDFNADSKFTIVCGRGNNGGDGFVIARHLYNRGYDVKTFVVGEAGVIKGDARINFDIIKKLGLEIKEIVDDTDLKELEYTMKLNPIVIDALFGTGLNQDVHGIAESVINLINDTGKYVISVDIPSGVSGDNGRICKTAVRADKTVTFALPKCGNVLYPGAEYNGTLIIKDIGIPGVIIDSMELSYNIIDRDFIRENLPKRKRDSHKGTYGKANIIAGSLGMEGAAILTCKSALRSGLGLLKLYIGESLNHIVKNSVPEAITVPLSEMRKGIIGINHIEKIIEDTKNVDVLAIGPGCGDTSELSEIIKRILQEVQVPIVMDADGLNVLAKNIEWLNNKKSPIIITPHMGEMSRLTGIPTNEIKEDAVKVAKEFSKEWNVITVLKGASTVIASPKGEVFINITGNPGMATAGSGDVLTGIITGLVGQGIEPLKATVTAVYIHGLTGDRVASRKGEYGLIAGDIVEELPYTIREIINECEV